MAPPLAGRPPFATDEPDSVYEDSEARTRRLRQPSPQNNRPDSTYDVYDNYLNDSNSNSPSRQSGYGNLGMGLLSGDVDSDSDSDEETLACSPDTSKAKGGFGGKSMADEDMKRSEPVPSVPGIPLMAPKPGYAAQVSALELSRPMQAHSPPNQRDHSPQMGQIPGRGMPIATPYGAQMSPSPRLPFMPPTMPSTPHPLLPPPTPIQPAFARPPKADIKFAEGPSIMRGKAEEMLLPKRGEKGDDFWRRFSMVVKEETNNRYQKSSWLKKCQSGSQRMSRWVWLSGVVLLCLIGGVATLGYFMTKTSSTSSAPAPIGGSVGQGSTLSITPKTIANGASPTSTIKHVTPTNTVAKRYPEDDLFVSYPSMPTPAPAPMPSGFIIARHRNMQKRLKF